MAWVFPRVAQAVLNEPELIFNIAGWHWPTYTRTVYHQVGTTLREV